MTSDDLNKGLRRQRGRPRTTTLLPPPSPPLPYLSSPMLTYADVCSRIRVNKQMTHHDDYSTTSSVTSAPSRQAEDEDVDSSGQVFEYSSTTNLRFSSALVPLILLEMQPATGGSSDSDRLGAQDRFEFSASELEEFINIYIFIYIYIKICIYYLKKYYLFNEI